MGRKIQFKGGLVNRIGESGTYPVGKFPEVGTGATIYHWSDRDPGTVILVIPERRVVVVQEDKWRRTDKNGLSEVQEYEYYRNDNGRLYYFRQAEDGGWDPVVPGKRPGTFKKVKGSGVSFGSRERYYDPSF